MLLFVTGASGSGKTTVIPGLKKKLPAFAIHDFDERGVPDDADSRWRQRETEYWISQAIEYQHQGRDTVICGGAVYGEILACPSITQIDHLAVCLMDCPDNERLRRIRGRGGEPTMDILAWAAWLRVHAEDPTWCPEVITDNSYDSMHWKHWRSWASDDPRWQQLVIETGGKKKVDQIVALVAKWIEQQVKRSYQNATLVTHPDQDDMLSADDS